MEKKLVGHVLFYALLALFGALYIFGRRGIGLVLSLKHYNAQLEKTIDALKVENKQLAHTINDWQQYPFYKEQLAREKLQLGYPEDRIYYVS